MYFTWVILRNSLPYFAGEPDSHAFVVEKGALAENPLWLGALIVHAAAGIVCLASSFLQFFRPVLRRVRWLHRWLGRVYVVSVLVILSPTGFYLAFFAHGGIAGMVGFLILGVLTFGSTWKGWKAMREGQTREHIAWMIRSMAMVTTAITFRLEHVLFQELGIHPDPGFLAALYLSIAGNALAAEWLLLKIRKRSRKKISNLIKSHESNPSIPTRVRARVS